MVYIILVAIIALAFCVLTILAFIITKNFLGRRIKQEQFVSSDFGIASEHVTIKTDDGINLAAWKTKSNKDMARGTIIIISGMEQPSVTAYFGFAKMFADNGWDSLLIEMRARGLSEGTTIGLGITEWLDVKGGVDFLSHGGFAKDLPIVVMGTSLGAATAIVAAGEIKKINAVIALSAFASIGNMLAEVLPQYGIPKLIAKIDKPFINMALGFRLGFNALKYSAINGIKKLGSRPILLMHSTEDDQVPYSQYVLLRKVAKENDVNITEFVREGNYHFIVDKLENPTQDEEFSTSIIEFLNNNFE